MKGSRFDFKTTYKLSAMIRTDRKEEISRNHTELEMKELIAN
jgi:hypothetical protein